jgi:DNA anti-recombination protein RmuC
VRKPVAKLRETLDKGLEGVTADEAKKRLREAHSLLEQLTKKTELSAAVYEDLIQLKSIYSHYQNYLNWKERA